MKIKYIILVVLLQMSANKSMAIVKVVSTTTDLKSIADFIGADKISSMSIATGFQNPHFVDPKPSYIISLSKADLFITVGLDLEAGWSPQLVTSSRNSKIQKGSSGYVDASIGVALQQIPSSVNREEGDIHAFGNPHYWLDPANSKAIAKNICDGLKRVDPVNAGFYDANLKMFLSKIDVKLKEWQSKMLPFKGSPIIAYHNEWCYFENRFGLRIVDFMEPKPGIPPSPSQLVKVINEVKSNKIKAIISSPYFTASSSAVVSKETGAKTIVLATSVGAFPEIKTYFDLFEYNISQLISVLSNS